MAISILDLKGILAAGGGFSIAAHKVSVLDLKGLAACAKSGGGQLTVTEAQGLSVLDLKGIAAAGKGHVTFDLGL